MATRYKIRREGGVIDRERGDAIVWPPDRSDPAWREYQTWRKAGNTPDVADAIAAPVPDVPTQDQLDVIAAREYLPLRALRQMTPAQAQAWVEDNVTNLATAKTVLKVLAVAVCIVARRL